MRELLHIVAIARTRQQEAAAKAWATGEGAISSDEQYENNAKYYAEAAGEAEEGARGYKSNAEDAQGLSEAARDTAKAWATGEGATSEDPQYENNAKYYSDRIAAYNPPESMSRPDFQTMLDNHTWIENQDYDVYEVEDALS